MSEFAIMPLSDYKNFCDAVRDKTGETDAITSSQMQDKTEDVYESGKRKERDAFWDAFQSNGTRVNYRNAFYGLGWTNENFNPKYDFHPTLAVSMFHSIRVTEFYKIFSGENARVLDMSNCTDCTNMFNYAYVDRVPYLDLRKCTTTETMFAGCQYLTWIDGIEFSENTTFKNTFLSLSALTHIIVYGVIAKSGFNVRYSDKLDKESLTSIVNALSTETSGLTVTVSLDAVKKAFETSTGANDGNTSAEWLALTQQRTNWTITLA